ncbi:MAG TPA: sigma-70 family RNA polymerase sigma factor [Mucilaginibacter sp.]|nr:sigma-70 family RNA polymerase sigma factor [Mucilaginibacter sp.]
MTIYPRDEELVTKILARDDAAFSVLIKNTEKLVSQIVFKMISSPADRKDIAQDVYVTVFRNLKDFRFQSKLSTWIGQIAYHACLKSIRKQKLVLMEDVSVGDEQFADADSGQPETLFLKKELSGVLRAAIEHLPPLYKTLISLFHQEELSYQEISEITGLPEGTIKSYLYRARRTLKENILLKYKREEL